MKQVWFRRALPRAAALIALMAPGLIGAQVTVLTVGPNGTYADIQDAIDAAVVGDQTEIRVQGGQTYMEVLQIDGSFTSGTLTVLGGWNTEFDNRIFLPQDTVIDAHLGNRALDAFGHAGDVTFDGFTFTNGMMGGPGGGIRIDPSGDSQVTLSNVRIIGNIATGPGGNSGGGLVVELYGGQRLEVTNCRIMDNEAASTDGGVVVGGGVSIRAIGDSTFLIQNCEIDNNLIETGGQAFGAGVRIQLTDNAQGQILDNSIVENSAYSPDTWAAGSYFQTRDSSALTVERTAIGVNAVIGDTAPQLWTSIAGSSVLTMRDSILGVGEQDGIDINADNTSTVNLVNLTIADNAGTGIHLDQFGMATITMYNTISYGNTTDLMTSGTVDTDFNLIGVDPLFSNPATYDYRLRHGSPAINAGTNTPPGDLGLLDFDGNPRIQGLVVDIGALEWFADVFANGFESGDTSSWSNTVP